MKRKITIMCVSAALLGAFGASAQEMALSTNLAGYANLGTMNLEASYAFARHWSVNAGMKFNPFSYDSKENIKMQNKQRLYSVGARFWPWHIYSGWWLAGKMQYQEFNTGGIVSKETSEGDRIGSGITGGYSYMLNPHFNFEFGVGLWAGYERFTRYECPVCGSVTDQGEKIFVLPNDLILSLTYVF